MEKFIHLFVWIEIYKVDKQKIKMFGEYKYENNTDYAYSTISGWS